MRTTTIPATDLSDDCRRRARLMARKFFPLDEAQAARLADFVRHQERQSARAAA